MRGSVIFNVGNPCFLELDQALKGSGLNLKQSLKLSGHVACFWVGFLGFFQSFEVVSDGKSSVGKEGTEVKVCGVVESELESMGRVGVGGDLVLLRLGGEHDVVDSVTDACVLGAGSLAQALESLMQSAQLTGLDHRFDPFVCVEHDFGLLQRNIESNSFAGEIVDWQSFVREFGDVLSDHVEVAQVLHADSVGLWHSDDCLGFIRQEWQLLSSEILHLAWSWDVMVVIDVVSAVGEHAGRER